MAKLNAIFDAIVSACASVTTANGYSVDVGEVVEGPIRVPDAMNAAISVAVFYPNEEKSPQALQRKTVDAECVIHVACKNTEMTSPGRQCIAAAADIEKAVEAFANGQFLALSYVTDVFVEGSVSDDYPPEIARDVRVRAIRVAVTYHHERLNP
jgi:hypothetical protein